MADSNPSVELAPLKGSIVLDLDQFDQGIEQVEEKVIRLATLFKICFNPNINIDFSNFNDSIDEAIKQADRLDDVIDSIENKRVNIDIEINEPSMGDIANKFPVGDNISPFEHFSNIDEQIQEMKKTLEDEIKYKDTIDLLNSIFPDPKESQNLNEVNSEIEKLNENLEDLESTSDDVADSEDKVTEAFNSIGQSAEESISKIENLTEAQIKSANALREANKSYISALGFDIGSAFENEEEELRNEEEEIGAEEQEEIKPSWWKRLFNRSKRNSFNIQAPFYERAGESGEKMLDKGMMGIWMIQPYIDKVDESLLKLGFTSQAALNMANREFGKNSSIITQWSQNAVTKMGLSSGEALSMADMFGISALSMGANKTQAMALSERLTALAQNITLATGGQVKLSDATSILTSMLGGSMYGLKSLGISFSTAQQNAEAAALGFGKSYKALTPLQQAFVNTALSQKGLNKSIGSLNENLNTSYGQWEKCKAQLSENGEAMMEQLMPDILKLMKGITNLVTKFNHLGKGSHILAAAFLGIATVISPLLIIIGSLFEAIHRIGKAFERVSEIVGKSGKDVRKAGEDFKTTTKFIDDSGKAIKEGLSIFSKMGTKIKSVGEIALKIGKSLLSGVLKIGEVVVEWSGRIVEVIGTIIDAINPVTAIITVVGLAIVGLAYAWHKNLWNIRTYCYEFIDYIKNKFDELGSWLDSIFSSIGYHINSFFSSIGRDFENFGRDILTGLDHIGKECLSATWNVLKSIALAIYNNPIVHQLVKLSAAIIHLLTSLGSALGEIVGALFIAIGKRTASFFKYLWDLSKEQFDLILDVFKNFGEWVGNIAINTFDKLKASFDNGLNTIENLWSNIWNSIANIFSDIGNTIGSYCSSLWSDISSKFDNGMATIKSAWDSGWNYISNIFSNIGSAIGSYMSSMWSDWLNMAESQLSAIGNVFSSMWSNIENVTETMLSSVGSAIQGAWSNITGWFSSVVGEPAEEMMNALGGMVQAGENLILGFLHGLENGWYNVTNWLSNKINDLANTVSTDASDIVGDITSWGNGSHATGLAYVPWDGYRAELHAGEMVLTKEQAAAYRNGATGSGGNVYNFYSPKPIDPFEAKRQLENANRRMANGFS